MKSILWFTCLYALVAISLLFAIATNNTLLQFIARGVFPLLLYFTYFNLVPKKRISKLYLGVIFCITIGEFFLTDSYKYFEYVIYSYLIAHVLFTIIIYRYYLRNESMFDVFTFSLPFLLTFSIIYILFNLDLSWGIKVVSLGTIACINASTVLLNYANNRTKQNYLFFLGVFIWLVADAFGGIYRFKAKLEFHFLLSIALDFAAQYLIFRAFLLDAKKDNYELDEF